MVRTPCKFSIKNEWLLVICQRWWKVGFTVCKLAQMMNGNASRVWLGSDQVLFFKTLCSLFVRRYIHKKPDEGDVFSAADNDDAMPPMEDEDSDSVTLRRRRMAAAAERRMQRHEPFWVLSPAETCMMCLWDSRHRMSGWSMHICARCNYISTHQTFQSIVHCINILCRWRTSQILVSVK